MPTIKKHAKSKLFAAGQLVLKKDFRRKERKGGKLDFRYLGHFEIKRRLGNGVFELADCNGCEECKYHWCSFKALP